MNELLRMSERDGCEFMTHADDIVLKVLGKFVDTIKDMMQLTLKRVSG